MSDTYKTSKARQARMLDRKRLDTFNSGERQELNKVRAEINELEVDGVRYGNHRKMYAREKVQERRTERKALNRSSKKDFSM